MKATELIKILKTVPADTEVFVNSWSPSEDYDRTSNVKVCQLGGNKKPEIVICDKKTEYWTREKFNFKTT